MTVIKEFKQEKDLPIKPPSICEAWGRKCNGVGMYVKSRKYSGTVFRTVLSAHSQNSVDGDS